MTSPQKLYKIGKRAEVAACLVVLIALSIGAKYGLQPFHSGFFCGDLTLAYPYRHSTVPTVVNVLVSYGVPLATIAVVQLAGIVSAPSKAAKLRLLTGGLLLHTLLFVFGGLCTQTVSNVCKFTAGRLRPHFFDVCRPLIEGDKTCENMAQDVFVTNYTCQGNHALFPDPDYMEDRIWESRLSFLSGHASISTYGMAFLILYVQFSVRRDLGLFKNVLQLGMILYAIYVGISRVCDYKHHPTDVLAGMVLGLTMALHLYFSQFFRRLDKLVVVETLQEDVGGGQEPAAEGEQAASNNDRVVLDSQD